MSKFKILLLSFVFMICGAYSQTETINWMIDGQTYTTTNCESGDDVVLPNDPIKKGYTFTGWREVVNRGTFATWSDVPTDTDRYEADADNNRVPKQYDYMLLENAATYNQLDYTNGIKITEENSSFVWTQYGVSHTVTTTLGVAETFYLGDANQVRVECDTNRKLSFYTTDFNTKVIDKAGGIRYVNTNTLIFETTHLGWNTPFTYEFARPLEGGTWRFVYIGDWATDGKAGWQPAEQSE